MVKAKNHGTLNGLGPFSKHRVMPEQQNNKRIVQPLWLYLPSMNIILMACEVYVNKYF